MTPLFAKQFLAIIVPTPFLATVTGTFCLEFDLLVNKNDSVLVLSVCFEKTTVEIYC